MLKYKKIIEQLTDVEKIQLLTDIKAFGKEEMRERGIPPLTVKYLRHLQRTEFPTEQTLANTWDTDLMSEIAETLTSSSSDGNATLMITPGAKIRFSPYRNEISEDPYLAARYSSSYAKGAVKAGVFTALSGFYITDTDAEMMDEYPSNRIINDFVIKPFADAVSSSGAHGIAADARVLDGKYAIVNSRLVDAVLEKCIPGAKAITVCEKVSPEHTVSFIAKGGIAFSASSISLEKALNRYRKMKSLYEAGKVSVQDIEREMIDGRAISDEIVDAALDRLLYIAFNFKAEKQHNETKHDALLKRSVEESIVLLKNDNGMLPLNPKRSVAILGGLAFGDSEALANKCEKLLVDSGFAKVTLRKGYAADSDTAIGVNMLNNALGAVSRNDCTVIFLGHGASGKQIPKTHKLTLPANQMALVSKLRRNGKKLIAVIESGYSLDIGMLSTFSAVLMAPFGVKYDAESIIDVLLGRKNPSGKLAYTLYSSFDKYYPKHSVYRDTFGVKSGPFIGYRYYDTAKLKVGYHFGHGLSYSNIKYYDARVLDSKLYVTLENNSGWHTREVVQVYASIGESAVLRPRAELCGFKSVMLAPGQTLTVEIDLNIPMVFDPVAGLFKLERGEYEFSIGPSLSDIRLTLTQTLGAQELHNDGEKSVDYIQSISNIVSNKFTLEAKYDLMKRPVKNIVSGVAALIMALSLGIFNALTAAEPFVTVTSCLLGMAAVVFFILEIKERNKQNKDERTMIDNANDKLFEDAKDLDEFNSKSLFASEFDKVELPGVDEEVIVYDDNTADESLKYINKSLDFKRAGADFSTFAFERGLVLDDNDVNRIFASIASSRLIIFKNMKNDVFEALIGVISEYFGTDTYIDTVDSSYSDEECALFGVNDESNVREKRNLTLALESAVKAKYNLHIAALNNVKSRGLIKYFVPFAKYVKNPYAYNTLTAHNEWEKETSYYIAPNTWFMLNLAENECFDAIPDFIVDIATVGTVDVRKCESTGSHTAVMPFKFYQLDFLLERVASGCALSEAHWKKIDRLVEFVNNYSEFSLGNKLCLSIERYASALISAGTERDVALDMTVASRLMPAISVLLLDKIPEEERSLAETVDAIFGEGTLPITAAVIKDAIENRAANFITEEEIAGEAIAAEDDTAEETAQPALEDSFANLFMESASQTDTVATSENTQPEAEIAVANEISTETQASDAATFSAAENTAEIATAEPASDNVETEIVEPTAEQPASEAVVEESAVAEDASEETAEEISEEVVPAEEKIENDTADETSDSQGSDSTSSFDMFGLGSSSGSFGFGSFGSLDSSSSYFGSDNATEKKTDENDALSGGIFFGSNLNG